MQHAKSASDLRVAVSNDQLGKPAALKNGMNGLTLSLAPQVEAPRLAPQAALATNGPDGQPSHAPAELGQRHTVTGAKVHTVERLVVVHRGAVGYGFVLRGPQALQQAPGLTHLPFTPSVAQPSLQHLERVEPDSPASRAGLHAGDYLLEVNGERVLNATHEFTVDLIRRANASSGTLYLKVVSADAYATLRGSSPPKDSSSTPLQVAPSAVPGPSQHISYTVGPVSGQRQQQQVLASQNQFLGRTRAPRRTLINYYAFFMN